MNNLHDIVFYHKSCSDGTTGLYVADKFYKEHDHAYSSYAIPAGRKLTEFENMSLDFANKRICFIDVCPEYDFFEKYGDIVESITVIDHHKSTKEMINKYHNYFESMDDIIDIHVDMEFAGCRLAWHYFYPNMNNNPWFIDYVEDRDLWKWSKANSKAINAAMFAENLINPWNFGLMDEMCYYCSEDIDKLAEKGKTIMDTEHRMLKTQLSQAHDATFEGFHIQIATCNRSMRSDFGNMLCEKSLKTGELPAFAVVWSYEPDVNKFYMSCRGRNDSPDLNEICQRYGGGGHAKAAGFETDYNPFIDDEAIDNINGAIFKIV